LWLVGRRRKKLTRGANISCAQRQGGCWANWPHPRSREEIFFLPCVLWVRRTTPRKEIGEGWVIIASCLHAGNPRCLAMSVKMRKINPLSGCKNIVVILKLNIPETEGAATQLNTEQDNLVDGTSNCLVLDWVSNINSLTNQTTNIRHIQYQYQFLSLRSKISISKFECLHPNGVLAIFLYNC